MGLRATKVRRDSMAPRAIKEIPDLQEHRVILGRKGSKVRPESKGSKETPANKGSKVRPENREIKATPDLTVSKAIQVLGYKEKPDLMVLKATKAIQV